MEFSASSRKLIAVSAVASIFLTGCRSTSVLNEGSMRRKSVHLLSTDDIDYQAKRSFGEYRRSVYVGKHMVDKDPTNIAGYAIAGTSYYYIWKYHTHSESDLNDALSCFRKIIELNPEDKNSQAFLSKVYYSLGLNDEGQSAKEEIKEK